MGKICDILGSLAMWPGCYCNADLIGDQGAISCHLITGCLRGSIIDYTLRAR